MALADSEREYGSLNKWLHWLVAIGILWLIWLGLEQKDLPSGDERQAIRATHASWALLIFTLMTVRLAWRLWNGVPAHPAGLPVWQRAAATLTHWGLYVVVFVQLSAGMMTVATGGKPLPFFGLFSIPLPVAENHDAHEFWEEVHEAGWILLAVLLGVHVLAALYNHFVRRNDVLRRMTVGVRS